MKLLPVLRCLILSSVAFSPDFRLEAHMETIPATDSSVQECYVFRTTAGVQYTVESSNDLIHWTSEEEVYGLGNEYVVTMRQFTPPPPPPPGSPPITFPPPAKNVSIRMERSSAAEGGTVVSWPSLDHGGPVIVRIAGEMVPEWFQIPLYFERFANYYFFVWHPRAVASPPAENSTLGKNDSAMLAVLEASLPTMNAQVAPAGERSSEFLIKAPLNASSPLKLSAPGIKFGGQDSVTLTEETSSVVITATDPAATGQDITLKIEMGPGESLSKPIGVKVMRARTVKVTIHKIGSIRVNKPTKAPDWFPVESEVENYLNKIFGTQINATFDVTLRTIRNLEWDLGTSSEFPGTDPSNLVVPGNGRFDYLGDHVMRSEISNIDSLSDSNANINIYILGGGRIAQVYEKDGILNQTASITSGVAYSTRNIIIIDGDIGWFNDTVGRDNNAELIHVIAHEIGHCIVGPGHPDEGGGKAPLKGLRPQSAVTERLMVTGPKVRRPHFGCRLVKGEWDEAEKWFVARPLTNN